MDLLGSKDLCTKVELSISCKDLLDRDIGSKSDPICLVEVQDAKGNYQEVGRTERIKDSLNPVFSERIALNYYFEQVQNLTFTLFDSDNGTKSLKDDDFLGRIQTTLGQIVSSKKLSRGLLKKNKKNSPSEGTITISATEVTDNSFSHFYFKAVGCDNKDFLGKSDPFLEVWRHENNDWSLCYRSEVVKNDLSPIWKRFKIANYLLIQKEGDRRVKLICYDADSDGSHDLIGECEVPMSQLQQGDGKEFALINPKKKAKKKNYKNSGVLVLQEYQVKKEASFLDYLFGGLQLNFTVGIDFTGSNGPQNNPTSLHYVTDRCPNEYQQSLYAVGNIIQDYDYDKMFPAFGFGAVLPNGERSHEFPLNLNPENPYCSGIHGISEAYKSTVTKVRFSGPTCISPIIRHVSAFASQQTATPTNYFVLLIMTDGEITDMAETKHAIVAASNFPMSIIIVGVGHADFSKMRELDGDDKTLTCPVTGNRSTRDIVQFVPFSKFKSTSNEDCSGKELARAVLAELPKQVTNYYEKNGIEPGVRQFAQ